MSFQPILPSGGLVGWKFLQRSYDTQTEVFKASKVEARNTDYFAAQISNVTTAKDLVADRRLLSVALGAFGLDDDLDSRYFIERILDEGTLDPNALANKMSDSRYRDLAKAFGFDLGVANTKLSTFPAEIVERYHARQFEVAVGEQDETLRLALNARRELQALGNDDSSDRTRWFKIMGNEPLRKVVEGALGLPDSFSQLDLDRQMSVFVEKSERSLGLRSLDDLTDPEVLGKIIDRFIIRSEMNNFQSSTSGSIALTLLQA